MVSRLLTRFLSHKKSILLLGPRQVGKSTLLGSLKPDLSINLARQDVFLRFASDPHALIDEMSSKALKTVLIDEIQRLPSLLNTIQAIIDESKNSARFFLTGSSARKLKRGRANLLPGRILDYKLGPLVSGELDYQMNSAKVLSFGTLPEVYLNEDSKESKKILSSYSSLYLREEIQLEALTRNLEAFSRFFMTVAETVGQYVDYTKLAKRAKISRHSCSRYFEVLEDTLIADRLFPDPEWIDSNDLIMHPKLFFFDCGVYNGLMRNFNVSPDRVGAMFEQLVYSQFKHSASARDLDFNAYTYRTRGGHEIDFIFKIENVKYAIECKATQSPNSDDVSNLKTGSKMRIKNKFLVHLGKDEKKIDGVWALPWQMLLKKMGL